MPSTVMLIPSAKRLMASLRNVGYDPPTAVADLVDNSVAAQATEVAIDVVFGGTSSWIRVADNGLGMTEDELDEALRFGTRRTYAPADLGKFGLGLKTASLSQCRRMTVATRRPHSQQVIVRQWDLDHVEDTDAWEATDPALDGVDGHWIAPLERSHGTVIVWDKLDRVSHFKAPDGGKARNALTRLCGDIAAHLAMVFHRFLAGESRRRLPLAIRVQGELLPPWDPFARSEAATQDFGGQSLRFAHEGQLHAVIVRPYILPNEAMFSSREARERAAGPNKWNHQQGFYVYRNDRLIQSGGWNRLRIPDEHMKLARIAVDFGSSSDGAFCVDVAKMRVVLPPALRNDLQAIASGVAQRANASYRRRAPDMSADRPPSVDPWRQARLEAAPVGPRESGWVASADDFRTLGDHGGVGVLAQTVVEVIWRELADVPALRARVLRRLSDAHPCLNAVASRGGPASERDFHG